MSSIAEIVEAPTDWYEAVDPGQRKALTYYASSAGDLADRVERAFGPPLPSMAAPDGYWSPPRLSLSHQLLNEVQDLLCSNERYEEERKSLTKEFKAGQSALRVACQL